MSNVDPIKMWRRSLLRLQSFSSIVLLVIFTAFPGLPLIATKRHADLSCSKNSIHLLPGVILKKKQIVEGMIFLHIPKTAGTNIDSIARSFCKTQNTFYYKRLGVPRLKGRSPVLITPDWIGGLQQLEDKPTLLDEIPENFFVAGHFPYGLHQRISKGAKYVTLVRDPIQRELSAANFDYQRGYIEKEEFGAYLQERMIDNPQVRLIAGGQYLKGPCTEETFQRAKENIERDFLLAAPSEDVDCFIQILAAIQNWGACAYAPMQITRDKVAQELDPSLAQMLLEKHRWDLKLYEWVKVRWNLWKERIVVAQKRLPLEELVLTLMPDYLTTGEPRWFSVAEIDSYNQEQGGNELLEIKQGMASSLQKVEHPK